MIREATELSQWKFVDTKTNPTDEVLRGQNAERFLQNKRWIRGPDILWRTECDWPSVTHSLSEDDPEVKKKSTVNVIVKN